MPISSIDFYNGQTEVASRARFFTMVAARDALMPLEIITEIERCLHHRSGRSIHLQVFGTYDGPVADRAVVIGMSEVAEIPDGPDCIVPIEGDYVGTITVTNAHLDMSEVDVWDQLADRVEEFFVNRGRGPWICLNPDSCDSWDGPAYVH
ncbi:MAG: hypothetical protein HN396_16775 [Gemmatimonadales bacterium]|mgnify:CR=1 FL=1|nr:hypothetical protein [Gemmatimonadales bacterium]